DRRDRPRRRRETLQLARRQRPVVDPDLVDQAGEVGGAETGRLRRVGVDVEGGIDDRGPGAGPRCRVRRTDLDAVDVQADVGAVEGAGDGVPLAVEDRRVRRRVGEHSGRGRVRLADVEVEPGNPAVAGVERVRGSAAGRPVVAATGDVAQQARVAALFYPG